MMKNIIFVSKKIGLECLKFHIDMFQDDNLVVVGEEGQDNVIQYLSQSGIKDYILQKNFNVSLLEDIKFDWLLNLWGGYIFKEDILSLVSNSLNIHPSYLPYCRGRDPVVWSILNGFPAGATLHEISLGVDEGDIYYKEEVPYDLPIKGEELYHQVTEKCIEIFINKWPYIRKGEIKKNKQGTVKQAKTYKRKDLINNREICYESLSEREKLLLRKILGYDFSSEYSSFLNINNKVFEIRLNYQERDPSDLNV